MASPRGTGRSGETTEASGAPLIAIFLAQVLVSVTVAALPIPLSGMIGSFDATPTRISTGIVTYGLVVAALVMAGAEPGPRFGRVVLFRS